MTDIAVQIRQAVLAGVGSDEFTSLLESYCVWSRGGLCRGYGRCGLSFNDTDETTVCSIDDTSALLMDMAFYWLSCRARGLEALLRIRYAWNNNLDDTAHLFRELCYRHGIKPLPKFGAVSWGLDTAKFLIFEFLKGLIDHSGQERSDSERRCFDLAYYRNRQQTAVATADHAYQQLLTAQQLSLKQHYKSKTNRKGKKHERV